MYKVGWAVFGLFTVICLLTGWVPKMVILDNPTANIIFSGFLFAFFGGAFARQWLPGRGIMIIIMGLCIFIWGDALGLQYLLTFIPIIITGLVYKFYIEKKMNVAEIFKKDDSDSG